MLSADYDRRSISDVHQAISNGQTVRSIVDEHLDAIGKINPELNAITVVNHKTLQEADDLDRLPPEQRGLLHGVPIVIKDQIETAGIATAFGSKCCKEYLPAEDATLIKKLKAAGAVIIGKSTMPDWAASWFSTSSLSGTTKNPYDLTREPGGSSSGSGAAVAANLAVVGIGGDTGGSIRLPSSFCGLVGVRVTPGRISRDGMSGLVATQDTPGPMTRSVEDAAKILDVIVGFDPKDHFTSVNAIAPIHSFQEAIKHSTMKGRRIGVLKQAFGTHKGILSLLDVTMQRLGEAGVQLVEVDIPDLEHFKTFTSVYGTRSRADINKFLSSRKQLAHLKIQDMRAAGDYHKALDLIEVVADGPEDFEQDSTLAARLLAQSQFQRGTAALFAEQRLDAIIYPTCQLLPPKTQDILDMRWNCLNYPTNTIIGSQLLFPAISVPIGKTVDVEEDPDGPELPVGLEILGLPLQEEKIMSVAAGIEALHSGR